MTCTKCMRVAEDPRYKNCGRCREVRRNANRRHYAKNSERLKRASAERNRRNPNRAEILRRSRKPEKMRMYRATRRAHMRDAFVENVNPFIVLAKSDGRCGICAEKLDPETFEVDHIVPLACGGEHSYANCQPAHRSCNRSKGDSWSPLPEQKLGGSSV